MNLAMFMRLYSKKLARLLHGRELFNILIQITSGVRYSNQKDLSNYDNLLDDRFSSSFALNDLIDIETFHGDHDDVGQVCTRLFSHNRTSSVRYLSSILIRAPCVTELEKKHTTVHNYLIRRSHFLLVHEYVH